METDEKAILHLAIFCLEKRKKEAKFNDVTFLMLLFLTFFGPYQCAASSLVSVTPKWQEKNPRLWHLPSLCRVLPSVVLIGRRSSFRIPIGWQSCLPGIFHPYGPVKLLLVCPWSSCSLYHWPMYGGFYPSEVLISGFFPIVVLIGWFFHTAVLIGEFYPTVVLIGRFVSYFLF